MREYLTMHGACSARNMTPSNLFVSCLDVPKSIYGSVTRLEALLMYSWRKCGETVIAARCLGIVRNPVSNHSNGLTS